MTVKNKLSNMLVEYGMFDSQAEKVMEKAMPELNSLVEDYSISFNRPSDEYPKPIYDVLFLAIKPIALKWIEENIPMAWYKPMFQ
ncbi:MAG: hypothetical protein WAT92_02745 [Saprospiraceae bacterium]